ncbi:YHYH protein [Spirosoma endbachense]|uniref:YHYH protein n=1 Tax=Spirosoma endbachense TaxID=2666025 RepID=A0A6P1VYD1_9BACT|nr:YHYH protein [Spirosoma endbachense]QHV97092.1 YHYH protein [Spirosoma endbachense]
MNRLRIITASGGLTLLLGLITVVACQKSDNTVTPATTTGTTSSTTATGTTTSTVSVGTGVPDVYKKIYGASEIYVEGTNIVIKTKGRPDHKSPYYKGTQWESSLYEAYNGTNTKFGANPNTISEFSLTFKIPMNPQIEASHAATPLGSIGIALNGVAFFNQYAAMRAALTNEINGFDQYGGHPQQQGQYHYHVEPTYLTKNKGKDALLGFLLDGFPVYGPQENGKTVTNADLDSYHGHSHATADYPNGIYHYHITAEDPYLNGSGFYGKAGTVTQ